VLRDTFAARLARALTPEDYATAFADPQQPSLFAASLKQARPILTVLPDPLAADASPAADPAADPDDER
jgi:DNA polymerase I